MCCSAASTKPSAAERLDSAHFAETQTHRESAACDGVQAGVTKEREAASFPHKRGISDGAAVCSQQLHLAHLHYKDLLNLRSNKDEQECFTLSAKCMTF
jgi:hypothetical protein